MTEGGGDGWLSESHDRLSRTLPTQEVVFSRSLCYSRTIGSPLADIRILSTASQAVCAGDRVEHEA